MTRLWSCSESTDAQGLLPGESKSGTAQLTWGCVVNPQMVKQSAGGKIINIGSLSPRHPSVVAMAAYDASKAGINGLTKNFALEMAPHQVAVNEIVPGRIRTPGVAGAEEATGMRAEQAKARTAQAADEIPLKRWGSADNVATVAIFLASSAADYMTGEVVVVDGGLLLT